MITLACPSGLVFVHSGPVCIMSTLSRATSVWDGTRYTVLFGEEGRDEVRRLASMMRGKEGRGGKERGEVLGEVREGGVVQEKAKKANTRSMGLCTV